jgi:serine/threonine protein kinase
MPILVSSPPKGKPCTAAVSFALCVIFLVVFNTLLSKASSRDDEAASLLTPSKAVKRRVAIKVLVPQAGITQHRVKLVLEETQISAALKMHPNIVKYYGICVDPPKIMLVFEYCNPGNLYEFMASCDPEAEVTLQLLKWLLVALTGDMAMSRQSFDFPVRLQLAAQGATALAYMHSFESPIIHRDVKVHLLLPVFLACLLITGSLPVVAKLSGILALWAHGCVDAQAVRLWHFRVPLR